MPQRARSQTPPPTPVDPGFSAALLEWYDRHKRELPWRDDGAGPYRTWVSEVMLQQTRVEAARPYFERWMARFPTVDVLADAPLDDVLSSWSGLGYYSRARNLHKAAQQVRDAGEFPVDLAGWRALPGVGPYIAGAVCSIALGLDEPAVDGNLERVLARVHAHPGGRSTIQKVARALIPSGRAGDFNQALMDLGSGTCRPKNPDCEACPVLDWCAGGQSGEPTRWPVTAKKKAAPERTALAVALVREGAVLVCRRPAQGLFGGLFELPGAILEDAPGPADDLAALAREAVAHRAGWELEVGQQLACVRHTLTHMRLTLHVFAASGERVAEPAFYTGERWLDVQRPGRAGLSTLARKAIAGIPTD